MGERSAEGIPASSRRIARRLGVFVFGVDLSNNNKGFDSWNGVEFAILKVTESTSFVDAYYSIFLDECQKRNIPFSGYHFSHFDVNSADDEAAFFLDHFNPRGSFAPAVDVEGRPGHDPLSVLGAPELAARVNRWCDLVGEVVNMQPLVYLNRSYATALFNAGLHLGPLWLATLDHTVLSGWDGRPVTICQYTIVGVDRNESFLPLPGSRPSPKEDDMSLHIFKGDQRDEWWLTDMISKRWVRTPEEAGSIVWSVVANGGHVEWNNGPITVPQAFIDDIPTVAEGVPGAPVSSAISDADVERIAHKVLTDLSTVLPH